MGLAALRRILDPQPCDVASLRGRVVAVDANNLLWTFVTAMREPPRAPDGRSVAHLIGLTNRLRLYAESGIRSVWVLDGPQPKLKDATLAERETRIESARATGDVAHEALSLSREQIREACALLDALGVPWMKAPGESDAQCAHFARTGEAAAVVSQDYDAALHGAPRTMRNLTGNPKRPCESIELDDALGRAGLTRAQLVDAAVLIGTDYNVGVKGVGPVKAVKLVREHGDLHGALAALGVAMPEADEVRALFLAHPVDKAARLRFGRPDAARVRDVMEQGGLSRARADALVEQVARLHEPRQARLG